MIQAVLLLVFVIAGLSFIVGLFIAIVTMIWTNDVAAAVQFISKSYYLLVGLMPVALWLGIYISNDQSEYAAAYNTRLRALLTTVQGALVGSLLGAGPIFLATVIYLPEILSRYPMAQLGPAVRDEIIWSKLILAVGAAVISAIPLGFWAYSTMAGQKAN